MESFTLYNPTLYEFGRGAEEKTGMLTFLMGVKKVLIVYGSKYVKTNGLLERIKMSLDSIGIEYAELPGAKPNPTDRLVYEGIRICREKHCDGLLAIGGGSVIDTAKAIAAGTPYQGDFWDSTAESNCQGGSSGRRGSDNPGGRQRGIGQLGDYTQRRLA